MYRRDNLFDRKTLLYLLNHWASWPVTRRCGRVGENIVPCRLSKILCFLSQDASEPGAGHLLVIVHFGRFGEQSDVTLASSAEFKGLLEHGAHIGVNFSESHVFALLEFFADDGQIDTQFLLRSRGLLELGSQIRGELKHLLMKDGGGSVPPERTSEEKRYYRHPGGREPGWRRSSWSRKGLWRSRALMSRTRLRRP